MKVYAPDHIRNVALVGHSGAGKTQLASALLFDTGAVNRLGRVDDGSTVTDFDEEEIARKHTLSAGTAFAEWNKTKINLIDTPGMANFFSDARAALRVADAAIAVVDAAAGAVGDVVGLLVRVPAGAQRNFALGLRRPALSATESLARPVRFR